MKKAASLSALAGLLLLSACTTLPTGPSQMSLPGTGKSFEQFRADDGECRGYAQSQAGTANDASANAGVKSAAVGTLIGAVAGAAMGGHQGAGVGAGTGLMMGTMAGIGTSQSSAYGTQRQYDNAYIQCMYSKGHKVPMPAGMSQNYRAAPAVANNAAPAYLPPPPPGSGYPR